jgi:hypothetical protein
MMPGDVTRQELHPNVLHVVGITVQVVSFKLKLTPDTVTSIPRGPEVGESDIVGAITVKVAETEPCCTAVEFDMVTVCIP